MFDEIFSPRRVPQELAGKVISVDDFLGPHGPHTHVFLLQAIPEKKGFYLGTYAEESQYLAPDQINGEQIAPALRVFIHRPTIMMVERENRLYKACKKLMAASDHYGPKIWNAQPPCSCFAVNPIVKILDKDSDFDLDVPIADQLCAHHRELYSQYLERNQESS